MTFSFDWSLADGYPKNKHNLKVFSTFACGGGSTMGYKLAGYDVLGCNEIDKDMMKLYVENHKPRFSFNEDIRSFIDRDDLPAELYDLDILDGSPPCSSFSFSGKREKHWGVKKQFREGQVEQRLDDLFFDFLRLVAKLKPKVVVAENVLGLMQGKAKGYVKEIVAEFRRLGYDVQLFHLNAAEMGVPQSRERLFFIANRCEFQPLKLNFNEPEIPFGQIRTGAMPGDRQMTDLDFEYIDMMLPKDKLFKDSLIRNLGRWARWNVRLQDFGRPLFTICSTNGSAIIVRNERRHVSNLEMIRAQTFPHDYNFLDQQIQYVLGMSVPPVMLAQIARQIYMQWFATKVVRNEKARS